MIKNLIFNKTQNTSVRFFIYMSSRCVQIFTAFEEVVLKLGVPWCPKIEYGRHFHGNQPRGKKIWIFFSIFFHTDHIINVQ